MTASKLKANTRLAVLALSIAIAQASHGQSAWVHYDNTHTLVYSNDVLGNHIPDFSYAGYQGGGVPLPTNAVVQQTVSAIAGDNTANIQNAINAVGNLGLDANGFRGVVLMNPGVYEVDGTLSLTKSGVILRGSGNSPTGTVLHFLGASRQTVTAQGSGSTSTQGSTYTITDAYVPLGATTFHVNDASTFAVGNLIVVQRPVTQPWVNAINMSNYWTAGSGLHFERTITAISGNQISVDIPLFNPIEQVWCVGQVYRVTDSSRMTNTAIENLRLRSDFDDASTNWGNSRALNIDNCKQCWIRDVVVDNFYNGINSGGGAKWLTVQDCYFVSNTVPTTSAGAAAFGGSGQMTLWQRCGSSSSKTYHVFVTQAAVPGPNVFLNFNSLGSGYDCGSHQRWAAGVLFDNDTIASTGGNTGIKLENRAGAGSGQGYAAGYSIIYNGNSVGIINEIPPVTNHYNWAIGGAPGSTFIHRSDDGIFDATSGYVNPRSLYLEQLRERGGGAAIENIGYQLFTISAAPGSQTITPGGNVNYSVSVGDPTLMSNIVTLSVSGLPANASASFNTNSVTGSGGATLTVIVSNNIAPGNYTLSIVGANAGVTHTTSVSLVVGSFSLVASPPSQSIAPGSNTTYTVTVTTNNNFSGSVNFGTSGLPAGANAGFAPGSLSAGGNSTLNVTTATNTPAGTYPVTIYGTNVAGTSATAVSLIVTSPGGGAPGTLLWTAGGAGDTTWSNPQNWTNPSAGGYGPPGSNINSIIFTNAGAVTASALTSPGSGVVVPGDINSFVNASSGVLALTDFANSPNTSPLYQNLGIAGGRTLTVGGTLQVGGYSSFDFGPNNVVDLTVSGTGGTLQVNGSLIVNATSASTGAHDATLDLSGLDTFAMNDSQLSIGVEGGGAVKRASGILYLARTNAITLTSAGYSDSAGTGSPSSGSPGLYVGHNASTFGSGSQLYLGVTNALFLDYATIGRGDTNALLAFNPAFLGQNPTVFIRGLGGNASRVGVYVVGDGSAGAQANNAPSTNDFSGGMVNALVNYLCVGRGRSGNSSSVGGSGVLTFDSGTINANTLAVGFMYPSGSNSPAIGTVNVNLAATLAVVSNLFLAQSSGVTGQTAFPQATLNLNGGTVQATNVVGSGGVSTINLNSGVLDLQASNPFAGSIANVSSLTIGGASGSALLENAAFISASNIITIASNGTLAGNTVITAPGLVVNGTVSPGVNGVGAITNSGVTTLGVGGNFDVALRDALGAPGAGWDFLQSGGNLNVQATNTNPFTIQLESFGPSGPGAATNFSFNTNYDWVIATTGGGLVNFSSDKFSVNNSQFQNDLAGGFFYVRTNGNSLVLSFTNNHPPVAGIVTLYRTGGTMVIPVSTLAAHWSDPDGDPVTLATVNSSSTNGTGNVSTEGSFIYYTNANPVEDVIIYTVQDVRTNPPAVYQPDDTVLTAAGELIILPPPGFGGIRLAGSNVVLKAIGGIPGGTCYLLGSTNVALPLSQWPRVATNTFDDTGSFTVTNSPAPNVPEMFYRLLSD
jgi:hypothetical protein